VVTSDPVAASAVLAGLGLAGIATDGPAVSARLGDIEPETIAPALVAAAVPIRGLRVATADLEDLFVGLTGEGFDVSQ
jgi:ABC-2 type transport system ATP-binding protein